jgi:tetratricopeptide (TPR) repeat protein
VNLFSKSFLNVRILCCLATLCILKLVFTSQLVFAGSKGQVALDRGTQYYKRGKYQEAVTSFKKATVIDPRLIMAWENLGWAYYKSSQTNKALKTWETILKVQPSNKDIRKAVGLLFMKINRWRSAIPHLTASLKSDPNQNLIRLRLGQAHQKIGQTHRAISIFRQALKIQPDSWEALAHLSDSYEKSGKQGLTFYLLKTFLASYPRSFSDEKREWIAVKLSSLFSRRGDEHYKQGQFKKAEASYKQAFHWKPGNKTILQNLGWALEKQEKYDEAIEAWLKVMERGYAGFQLFHQIANAYYHSEKFDQAEIWFQNTAGIDPSAKNVQLKLFELALRKKEIPHALIALQHAVASSNDDSTWPLTVANHFIRNESIDSGLEFFLKRPSHSSNSETTKLALGRLYTKLGARELKEGNVPKAILNYEKAILYDGLNASAFRDLGWLYQRTDKSEESERVWRQYQKKYPDSKEPYNLLSRFYLNQGAYKKSLVALKKSLKIDPDQPDQKLLQAKALYWNKKYPEALERVNRIVRKYPNHLPIQYFYGEVLMQQQDFKKGQAQWRKVLDMGSIAPRAHFYWIKSLYEVGEYEDSVREAQKFLDQQLPYRPVIKLLVNDALFRQDKEQAVFWYETLLNNFGDHPGEWLELAKLLMDLDRFTQANVTLKKAERIFPGNVEIQLVLGDLQAREGKYEEALEIFRIISGKYPDNRRAYLGAFRALKALGRLEEAIQLLQSNQDIFLKNYEVNLELGHVMVAKKNQDDATNYYSRVADPIKSGKYVPILLYHGLSDHPRSSNLWVQHFDQQLKALADAGYTTLTVTALGDILSKKLPFPEKMILITFDDSRRDAFRLADPVLNKYDMKATMFVPTAKINTEDPFFADWNNILNYARSGRWDLQAHGHEAHDSIPTDSNGAKGNFLTDFLWSENKRRQETAREFYARLDKDYQQNVDILKTHIPGLNVVGYAYPFSEAGQSRSGNAQSARATNQALLEKYFQFGFIRDHTGYNWLETGLSKTALLRRFTVPRDWDGERLIRHLSETHPKHLAKIALAKSQYWNGQYADAGQTFSNLILQKPWLKDKFRFNLANISYQGGNYQDSKELLDGIPDQESALNPKMDALKEAVAWKNRPRVSGAFDFFRDSNDRTNHTESLKIHFPMNVPLELMLEGGILNFKERNRQDIDGGQMSAGFYWRGWKPLHLEGKVRHRILSQTQGTQNYFGSARYRKNAHEFRFNGAKRDIDTVRALENEIQVKTFSLGYQNRFSTALLGRVGVGTQNYDDGNTGFDVRTSLRYQLPKLKNWNIGADLSFRDSEFEADAYYTPDQLLIGLARILYQHRFGKNAEVRVDFGLGGAEDKVNGSRWVTSGGFNFDYFLTRNLKAGLESKFSVLPGYDSVNVQAVMGYRF